MPTTNSSPAQRVFLDFIFKRAKAEILADIERGVVPADIDDYAHLQRFVAEPGNYGGRNEEEIATVGAALFPPPAGSDDELGGYWLACDAISQRLHQWLGQRDADAAAGSP